MLYVPMTDEVLNGEVRVRACRIPVTTLPLDWCVWSNSGLRRFYFELYFLWGLNQIVSIVHQNF